MNKKRIITISAIVIIVVISIICICIITVSDREKDVNAQIKTETLDISQVFELEDIQKSKYEIEKINDIKISSKYCSHDFFQYFLLNFFISDFITLDLFIKNTFIFFNELI